VVDQHTQELVLTVVSRHAQSEGRPAEFELLGLTWDLMDGVFAPIYTASTELYSSWLPYPEGGSFLEVGCGTGVTAVLAALRGCRSATALDISATAVENTRRNAERHGVADRVRVLRSDVFAALEPDARFDVIFWNSSFVEASPDFVVETELQHAFFDPGYRSHEAFVTGGPAYLTEGGRMFLGFGHLGNRELLDDLAAKAGLAVRLVRQESRAAAGVAMDFQLLELDAA
jgi:release factor glutamine methyltransferase